MTQQDQKAYEIDDFINPDVEIERGPITPPKASPDPEEKTGFALFMERVNKALAPVSDGFGFNDFADACWMDLFTETGGECSDRTILEFMAQADCIFAEMLAVYDGKDPDPKGPTMESIINGNIEKAETAAAELGDTPTEGPKNTLEAAGEEIRAAAAIDPALGIVAAMQAVGGKREPYRAEKEAAKVFTVEFYGREPRSFRAGDYAKNWSWQSFRGEGRAASALGGMLYRIDQVRTIAEDYLRRVPEHKDIITAAFDAHAAKHIEFSLAYIANNSRLASAMVTGPSKFPAARQRKLSDQHHNKYLRLEEHVKIGAKRLRRAAFPHGDPKDGIRSNNPEAVQLLEAKIAKLEKNQDYYKKANRDVKAAMKTADPIAAMIEKGYSPELAKSFTEYEYSWMKTRAFDTYVTTNNLAKIKTAKARLVSLKKVKATETANKQYELENGETFELVRNRDAMRIQLIFSGKPSGLTRAALKSNGFKWAPSQTAWQRHLNNNGEYALERVLKALEATESEDE